MDVTDIELQEVREFCIDVLEATRARVESECFVGVVLSPKGLRELNREACNILEAIAETTARAAVK